MDDVILTHLPTGIRICRSLLQWDQFIEQRKDKKFCIGELYNRFMCVHAPVGNILTYSGYNCDEAPRGCYGCPFNHGDDSIIYHEECYTFEQTTSK